MQPTTPNEDAEQPQITDPELWLEVAIVLLPIVSRHLTSAADSRNIRRLVIDDIATKWLCLVPDEQKRYGTIADYTECYIDTVEVAGLDPLSDHWHNYDESMAHAWHTQAANILKLREAQPDQSSPTLLRGCGWSEAPPPGSTTQSCAKNDDITNANRRPRR